MAGKDPREKKFEEALEELEGLVEQLETGELSLEESLSTFERGVGLVKICHDKLHEVEKKVELLVKEKDGRLRLTPLDEPRKEETGGEEN